MPDQAKRGRPRTRRQEIETLQVPHETMAFADARIAAIVRRCCTDPNIIESIARSCYLQGVWDGAQVALARPEVLAALAGGAPEDDHG
jgi:hypothetical protein